MKKIHASLCYFIGFYLLTSCAHTPPPQVHEVDLTPNDPRPVYTILVEDDAEIALLEQQLELKPLLFRESTLYFVETPGLIDRLREVGYTPMAADSYQAYQRVVRVKKRGNEQELQKLGVRLINREPGYWIVQGSLAQLIALERIGYRLTTIAAHEPRPREVKLEVHNREDVAWLSALQVDIFTVQETKDGYVVYGGAFDYQIDQIRTKGLKVDLIDTVGEGEKK